MPTAACIEPLPPACIGTSRTSASGSARSRLMTEGRSSSASRPEYEDGRSAMLLADTIRFQLLPHAGPDTEPVLFEALLAAAVMNDDMERGIARYGQRAAGATLDFAGAIQPDRRRIGSACSVGCSRCPPSTCWLRRWTRAPVMPPLRPSRRACRKASRRSDWRRSARHNVVVSAARFPCFASLPSRCPMTNPHRLRQAAAEAVATLGR